MPVKTAKYSPEQEQALRDASPMDAAKAKAFAAKWDMKPRSVTAKAVSMPDVEYTRKAPVSKTGDPVERKADIVNDIAAYVDAHDIESLVKASKSALVGIREALQAND